MISVSVVVLLVGCSTAIQLTDAGSVVRHVTRADMPTSCRLLGDVAIGIPPDAARPSSEEELSILLRNKAGREGGNLVVTEMSERREDSAGQPYYRGRGSAYRCTEEPGRPAEATETGGGEETGEAPEGTEPSSGEDDAIVDDLLAD